MYIIPEIYGSVFTTKEEVTGQPADGQVSTAEQHQDDAHSCQDKAKNH